MSSVVPTRPRIVALTGELVGMDVAALDPIRDRADLVLASSLAELAREIVDADILLIWDFRFAELDALLPSAQRLRWIHAASVGVDALLTPNLAKQNIVLTNSRGVFDRAMAEYVLGLYLMHLKGFRATLENQAHRRWEHRLTARAVGRRAVVVGSGSIGREIATLLDAAGLQVQLVGRRAGTDPVFGEIRPSSELAQIVADADLLALAAPGTPANRHLVDAEVLGAMPAAAYLINVGRGLLIDEDALIAALSAGSIAGAALDVFAEEPLPSDSPLWELPTVVVSPHMSADFQGFDAALVTVFLENLRRHGAQEPLTGVVDLELGYVSNDPSGANA